MKVMDEESSGDLMWVLNEELMAKALQAAYAIDFGERK